MRKRSLRKGVLLAGLSGLALLAAGTSQGQLFMGEEEILRQARLQWLNMKRHLPRADERTQAYVECVAYEIIDVLDEPHRSLDWEVIAFADEAPNAAVLPGGKVAVFTGILRAADTPDALGAVIGHEAAHLTADHVLQRAKKRRRTEAWTLLGGAATGMRGEMRGATTILMQLPYQREQESEADRIGLDYMAEAGFDPRASLILWKHMRDMRETRSGERPPEFLSTHPADDVRMHDLARAFAETLPRYNEARAQGRYPGCQVP